MEELSQLRFRLGADLKQLLKRKLEDVVDDIMGHPTQVPVEFKRYKEIAKQNGFSETVKCFEEIEREVGSIQIDNSIQRRLNFQRRDDEKKLQAYFVENNGQRLVEIEPGLQYQAHEKTIRAGRLDIQAKDSTGKEVKIELKARDYDHRAAFYQIMGYFNDDKTGDARLVFIAPEVHPKLLSALTQYEKVGRMSFFQVEKTNGNYTLTRVKPEDVPEPKQINWRTTTKTQTGLVNVVSAPPREKGITEREEDAELEKIKKEWTSYPMYYRLLILTQPDLKDKEKYLQPIEANSLQIAELESLLNPPELLRAIESLEERLQFYVQDQEAAEMTKNPRKIRYKFRRQKDIRAYHRGEEVASKYNEDSTDRIMDILKALSAIRLNIPTLGEPYNIYNRVIGSLKDRQRELEQMVKTVRHPDSTMMKYRKTLGRIKKDATSGRVRLDKYSLRMLGWELFEAGFYLPDLVSQFLKIKLERAEALVKVNPVLGLSYLSFDLATASQLGLGLETKAMDDSINIITNPQNIFKYVLADKDIYESMLTNFRVRYELKPPLTLDAQVIDQPPKTVKIQTPPRQPKTIQIQSPKPPKPQYALSSVMPIEAHITYQVTEDNRLRAQYFVEEVLNNDKYPEEARAKLAHDALASRWYKRDWAKDRKNISPEEIRARNMSVRNLFDDLTLRAVRGNNKH